MTSATLANELIGLNEHNRQREIYWKTNPPKPRRNGIACPKCGNELIDQNPAAVLGGNPPRTYIFCQKCKFAGLRNV